MRIASILASMVLVASTAGCTVNTPGSGSPPPRRRAAPGGGQAAPPPGSSAQGPGRGAPPAAAGSAADRTPATYTDTQGTRVRLETGDAAFADRVVTFDEGSPVSKYDRNRGPDVALGPPDYDESTRTGFLTLGCGGSVTLAFDDVLLRDRAGPDLHVFEVGPDIESILVEISTDGRHWDRVGVIEGQPASVDIAEVAAPAVRYGFVRLTDQRDSCGSRWPGADIDALAVIGD